MLLFLLTISANEIDDEALSEFDLKSIYGISPNKGPPKRLKTSSEDTENNIIINCYKNVDEKTKSCGHIENCRCESEALEDGIEKSSEAQESCTKLFENLQKKIDESSEELHEINKKSPKNLDKRMEKSENPQEKNEESSENPQKKIEKSENLQKSIEKSSENIDERENVSQTPKESSIINLSVVKHNHDNATQFEANCITKNKSEISNERNKFKINNSLIKRAQPKADEDHKHSQVDDVDDTAENQSAQNSRKKSNPFAKKTDVERRQVAPFRLLSSPPSQNPNESIKRHVVVHSRLVIVKLIKSNHLLKTYTIYLL